LIIQHLILKTNIDFRKAFRQNKIQSPPRIPPAPSMRESTGFLYLMN